MDPANVAVDVPEHVTLLYPFVDTTRLNAEVVAKIYACLDGQAACDAIFEGVCTFPTVAYLALVLPAAFDALIARLSEAFPECPPYEGVFADPLPHLTVGKDLGEVDWLRLGDEVTEAYARGALPLHARVDQIHRMVEGDDGRWSNQRTFDLWRSRANTFNARSVPVTWRRRADDQRGGPRGASAPA